MITDIGFEQWLALITYELLLFAGFLFFIGAADDLAVDALLLWLRLTDKAEADRRKRTALVTARCMDPRFAAVHHFLWRTELSTSFTQPPPRAAGLADALPGTRGAGNGEPPFLAAPLTPQRAGRWSMDAWGFWRQGSNAALISQGRVRIYGASYVGAVLQYRLLPQSGRDPQLYVRAYRALVRRGESELALGASLRPLARVPVAVFGEMRGTEIFFRTQTRPSAFAVSEIAPCSPAARHAARSLFAGRLGGRGGRHPVCRRAGKPYQRSRAG